MAKKSKSESAAPKLAERALDDNARGYWLTRAEKFAAQGQLERLAETLDRLWPDAEAADRWAWMAMNAPAMLAQALAARAAPAPEPCLVALADTALEWPPALAESLLSMPCLPPEFVADARALREASEHLAQGRDGDAALALKRIGRESRFRDAQRFLRGLGAFYRRDVEAARLALGSLLGEGPFAKGASALLAALGGSEVASPGLVAMLPVSERDLVRPVVAALAAKHPNQAISALAAALPKVSPPLRHALVRDFPGALLVVGVPEESIIERLKKAVPGLGTMVDSKLLDALTCEHAGYIDDALDVYAELSDAWSLRSAVSATDRALLYHRMGSLELGAISGPGEQRGPRVRCADCGQYHDDEDSGTGDAEVALGFLEQAVELAPGDLTIWKDLVRAAELSRDRKVRGKILEQFVARFPADPTALMSAAEAAGARGSFDKAIGFAEAAAELSPLDREPRAFVARLLIGKARKKYRETRLVDCKELVARALALPLLDSDARQRVTAAAAAVRMGLEAKANFVSLRTEATQGDPRPWLWTLRFADEWRNFLGSGPKQRYWPALPKAALQPLEPPVERGELAAMLQVYRDAVAEESYSVSVFRPILFLAVESAPRSIATSGDARLIMELSPPAALGYAVALRATELAPDDVGFVIYLYERALDAQRPAEDFAGATERLTELLANETLLRGYAFTVGDRLRRLRSDIELYLRYLAATLAARPAGRSRPASPKSGAKGRSKAVSKVPPTTAEPKPTPSAEPARQAEPDASQLALPLE